MTIRTQSSRNFHLPVHHLVAGATAVAIVGIVLLFNNANETSSPTDTTQALAAWTAPDLSPAVKFNDEMALHEALTEATFGSRSQNEIVAAAAIAEHSALFPEDLGARTSAVRDTAAETAWAIAQHSSYFPGETAVSADRGLSDEALAAIAQHSSYFPGETAVSADRGLSNDALAAIAEHDALIEPFVS